MTPVSHGKPCAGNPHARFEEGASAPEKPRRNALLHNTRMMFVRAVAGRFLDRINRIDRIKKGAGA